jgi:Zn ribbon nucleic-acid-binding protein
MGNVALMCPTCRGMDVDKRWTYGNAYLVCKKCGYRWR